MSGFEWIKLETKGTTPSPRFFHFYLYFLFIFFDQKLAKLFK